MNVHQVVSKLLDYPLSNELVVSFRQKVCAVNRIDKNCRITVSNNRCRTAYDLIGDLARFSLDERLQIRYENSHFDIGQILLAQTNLFGNINYRITFIPQILI